MKVICLIRGFHQIQWIPNFQLMLPNSNQWSFFSLTRTTTWILITEFHRELEFNSIILVPELMGLSQSRQPNLQFSLLNCRAIMSRPKNTSKLTSLNRTSVHILPATLPTPWARVWVWPEPLPVYIGSKYWFVLFHLALNNLEFVFI